MQAIEVELIMPHIKNNIKILAAILTLTITLLLIVIAMSTIYLLNMKHHYRVASSRYPIGTKHEKLDIDSNRIIKYVVGPESAEDIEIEPNKHPKRSLGAEEALIILYDFDEDK